LWEIGRDGGRLRLKGRGKGRVKEGGLGGLGGTCDGGCGGKKWFVKEGQRVWKIGWAMKNMNGGTME
jgi:hypothetical protein